LHIHIRSLQNRPGNYGSVFGRFLTHVSRCFAVVA
jgi:hypothetical protein